LCTVVLLAEFISPALWRDWLSASINELGYTDFWLAVGQIIFINVLLSGDNAIVIAMACRDLPEQQRRWGLIIGAGFAALLRIIFTIVLTELMTLPYLKLIGGAALLYIAAKLLVPKNADTKEVKAAAQLWRAVMLILVADIVMSFDNVVAIAAAARGDFLLLAIGLAISIPLLIGGAALLATLIDRAPVLIWAGAALLGWIAGQTMATDPAVTARFAALGDAVERQIEFAASAAAALLAIAAGGLWRRLHESNPGVSSKGDELLARVFAKFSQIWTKLR
jgi:YjbE family integral membrane protein